MLTTGWVAPFSGPSMPPPRRLAGLCAMAMHCSWPPTEKPPRSFRKATAPSTFRKVRSRQLCPSCEQNWLRLGVWRQPERQESHGISVSQEPPLKRYRRGWLGEVVSGWRSFGRFGRSQNVSGCLRGLRRPLRWRHCWVGRPMGRRKGALAGTKEDSGGPRREGRREAASKSLSFTNYRAGGTLLAATSC